MHTSPRALLWSGVLLAGASLLYGGRSGDATPHPAARPPASADRRALAQSLEETRAELTLARLQLVRLDAIVGYAVRYQIGADVATDVYDIALAEGIDPELAFRLVKVESNFASHATSAAGAIGYTQLLPSTARLYNPGLTLPQLFDRRVNLRLGFRYLRDLLDRYAEHPRGQLQLALLAYNRGPVKVDQLLESGRDPQNGYATAILRGYR